MTKKNNKDRCDLPDIIEFLKLSRIFTRQIDIFMNSKIPKEYLNIVKETSKVVNKKVLQLEEELNHGYM